MAQTTPGGIDVIVRWLTRYCEVYRKEMTRELFETYRDVLGNFTAQELELGFSEAMRRTKFFPVPADIVDALYCALEKMPRAREADAQCEKCHGDGWKIIEKEGYKFAITCECRKRKSA